MMIELSEGIWRKTECAHFMRSRERHGQLSNMTSGYPLIVNGLRFQGPEGLYQAMKFPGSPDAQRAIARQHSGMDAKKTAYALSHGFRRDWEEVKLDAMALTLAVKLIQHPERFGNALGETGDMDIVEMSNRDAWWGAKPEGNILRGINVLGKLLTLLRDLRAGGDPGRRDAAAQLIALTVPGKLSILEERLETKPQRPAKGIAEPRSG